MLVYPEGRLHDYYQRVLDAIHGSGRFLILGAGRGAAKLELISIEGVELVDKMTRRQLVAEVTSYFFSSCARRRSSGIDSPGASNAITAQERS